VRIRSVLAALAFAVLAALGSWMFMAGLADAHRVVDLNPVPAGQAGNLRNR
jgi:hypothetical protein